MGLKKQHSIDSCTMFHFIWGFGGGGTELLIVEAQYPDPPSLHGYAAECTTVGRYCTASSKALYASHSQFTPEDHSDLIWTGVCSLSLETQTYTHV